MAYFRKKPVTIEAVQFNGNNGSSIKDWASGTVVPSPVLEPTDDNPTGAYLQIKTLEGVMTARVGDWIIKGVRGEFYPCKPDIFGATYEPATAKG
jgi:hypothetical protein